MYLYKNFAIFSRILYNSFWKEVLMLPTIGQRVRAAREQRGMSQADLARKLEASVNAINMLEQDKIHDPRASRIIGIARVLKVSAGYLLGLEEEDNEIEPAA
jgi:transcriptional regulator with XRE-family HTH domain